MDPTLNDPKHARKYFADKLQFTCGPANVKTWTEAKKSFVIVDVRREADYAKGHIPGAVNLPFEKWSSFAGLAKDRLNVVYCYSQTCHLASQACLDFAENGYSVSEMEGGFETWAEYYPNVVEKRELAGAGR